MTFHCLNKLFQKIRKSRNNSFKPMFPPKNERTNCTLLQSNLVIRNFLVTLKLFINTKCSLSLWSKLTIGHGKGFLNTNLFLIKTFLITKFDCSKVKSFVHFLEESSAWKKHYDFVWPLVICIWPKLHFISKKILEHLLISR